MVVIVLRPGTVQPVETLKVLFSSVLQGTNATGKAKTSKNENKKKNKKKQHSKDNHLVRFTKCVNHEGMFIT